MELREGVRKAYSAMECEMINKVILYIASLLPIVWGIAHLFPTKSVVKGFGEISNDNKLIITMEWIIEGVALIFIGSIIFAVTIIIHSIPVSEAVYWISFGALNALSIVSLFTGARIDFLPFRLCPVIFTGSSILILVAILL